jgi:hypothetical protein
VLERSFGAQAVRGALQLDFVPVAGEAIVSAIAVEPVVQQGSSGAADAYARQ